MAPPNSTIAMHSGLGNEAGCCVRA